MKQEPLIILLASFLIHFNIQFWEGTASGTAGAL